jgi:hypothetical protein
MRALSRLVTGLSRGRRQPLAPQQPASIAAGLNFGQAMKTRVMGELRKGAKLIGRLNYKTNPNCSAYARDTGAKQVMGELATY